MNNTFLLLVVTHLLFASLVWCDDIDQMGGKESRDVQVSTDSNGIRVDSQSRTDTQNKLHIDIELTGSGGPGRRLQARLRSFSHSRPQTGDNAVAHVDFRAKFEHLIEYLEVDGVPGLSGSDTTGTDIDLGLESYTFAVGADQGTRANPIKVATAASPHFKITCKIGSVLFNDSGIWAFTNSVKIDVDISTFPYSLGPNARIALVMGMVSELTQFKSVTHDDDQTADSNKVVVKEGGASGTTDAFFSWFTTVDVTSPPATAAVIAGPLTAVGLDSDDGSSQDHKRIVYSFNATHPDTIHWDPVIGVSLSGTSVMFPCMAMVVFLLSVVISFQ